MQIIQKELRQGFKAFLIWSAGLAFLILCGMVKFSGMSSTQTGGMNEMLAQMPKPVLALFGMSEANIETLGGFYAVLEFYAMIVIACYAVSLGTSAVLRESVDKTYEFLFTKPWGRMRILTMKLLAGLVYLTLLCVLNGVFSWIAPGLYGIENTVTEAMLLYAAAVGVVGLVFFAAGVCLSMFVSRPERAVQLSYGVLLLSYGLSVVFDMDERFACLRPVTLLRYFRAGELLDGKLHPVYLIGALTAVAALLTAGYLGFRQKDLSAA